MQFNDQPQHVTIGISSDDLPAAVRLRSARLCLLECMPQIGKRDAALLHRGPRVRILRFASDPFTRWTIRQD